MEPPLEALTEQLDQQQQQQQEQQQPESSPKSPERRVTTSAHDLVNGGDVVSCSVPPNW